jgi:hypothetical protein
MSKFIRGLKKGRTEELKRKQRFKNLEKTQALDGSKLESTVRRIVGLNATKIARTYPGSDSVEIFLQRGGVGEYGHISVRPSRRSDWKYEVSSRVRERKGRAAKNDEELAIILGEFIGEWGRRPDFPLWVLILVPVLFLFAIALL